MPTLNPRVDDYIAKAAPFAQPILKHLRGLVHRACPEVVENIKWSMPSFEYKGGILCSMASFKAHAAFGFWHEAMEKKIAGVAKGEGGGMGHLGRITSIADLPSDKVMLAYLREAMALSDSGKPARPRASATPKPEAKIPEDLAGALKKNRKAARHFGEFSPSARREYVNWLVEAKRPETRASRLTTAIEWISEGKQRHWKYQNC